MILANNSNNKYIEGVKYFDQYDMHCTLLETHDFHLESAMKLINTEYPNTYKPSQKPKISSYPYKIKDFAREWNDVDMNEVCRIKRCKFCFCYSYENETINRMINECYRPVVEKMSPLLKSHDISIKWKFWARMLNKRLRLSFLPKIEWDWRIFYDLYRHRPNGFQSYIDGKTLSKCVSN